MKKILVKDQNGNITEYPRNITKDNEKETQTDWIDTQTQPNLLDLLQ